MQKALRRLRQALGLRRRIAREDRRVLEDVVFPHLSARADVRRVLFVGCAWYTAEYERVFDGEYWTIDVDPDMRAWGARRHIVDSVARLDRHVGPAAFDLIVLNGVLGWGLNDRSAIETAFAQCWRALRAGGMLVVGWNDVPAHRPVALEEIQSLARFAPWVFPPLGVAHYLTGTRNRHTFDFYRKPEA